mgnify:CR=1 FL=1
MLFLAILSAPIKRCLFKKEGNIIRINDIYEIYKPKERKKIKPIGFKIGNKKLNLTNNDGKILVVDLSTGKVVKTQKVSRETISKPFINNENLYIAENATLILPLHKELDEIREDSKNTDKIGTTRKGIGPAYEDKIGRRGIRVMDLANEKNLSRKIDTMLFHHNSIRKGLGKKTVNKDQLIKELLKISSEILKYSKPTWKKLAEFKKDKKTILFEGAQGVLLDVDHGTYPFVTSSNTISSGACNGLGLAPNKIKNIRCNCWNNSKPKPFIPSKAFI